VTGAAGTVVVAGGTVRGGSMLRPVAMSTAHVLFTHARTFSDASFAL
jgi:hypothetical protein